MAERFTGTEQIKSPSNIYSVDFFHTSSLVVVDLRPEFETTYAALLWKRGVIAEPILRHIETSERMQQKTDPEVLKRYASYVAGAVNQIRPSEETPKLTVVITRGPIENFFETERWKLIMAELDGRLDFRTLAHLFRELTKEETANLPRNLIDGDSLAGVATMWEPGEVPSIDFTLPLVDKRIMNN